MVYPGVGWALWRTKEDLPEELVFKVAYLGQEQARRTPTELSKLPFSMPHSSPCLRMGKA